MLNMSNKFWRERRHISSIFLQTKDLSVFKMNSARTNKISFWRITKREWIKFWRKIIKYSTKRKKIFLMKKNNSKTNNKMKQKTSNCRQKWIMTSFGMVILLNKSQKIPSKMTKIASNNLMSPNKNRTNSKKRKRKQKMRPNSTLLAL